ncbi:MULTISPECIES: helix-turn-helix transcriptional regulator [Bradyrhizobium]|uniref:helix-turn-helix transcriptional regulator n=1 Tax=Bradyrhizobium TaxID=374 RepID=UPI0009EE14AE|nr:MULTISPECIES: helix-turn-helix transcriptional regulator [Bradyrhizobium]
MVKLKVEKSQERRPRAVAEVSSKTGGRSLADLVERIERADANLGAEKKLSSAAMRAGEFVRAMRKDAGLSQSQLADKLCVSQARISEIESGVGIQGPTWDLMERISVACGKTLGVAASSDDLELAAHMPMAV